MKSRILFSALFLTGPVMADITLSPPFGEHMVLQRRMTVPVWGTAGAGEAVNVSFRGQARAATAGTDGKWVARLDAGEAGGPFELVVAGRNTVAFKDVLVGEVWLAGGQSNMAWTMKTLAGANLDSAKAADYPNLRLMNFQGGGRWNACTPLTVLDFSGTGYYFGRDLHKALNIPVGIMLSAIGGTDIERWMDPAAIAAEPTLAGDTAAGTLYAKWIAPLAPFSLRGAIWYQGENNARFTDALKPTWVVANYRKRFDGLIRGWRKVWNQGDFPFYYVQLPNINQLQTSPSGESPWAEMREAQRLSLTTPNTGMAVAIDIGLAEELHPPNKWDIGKRLADMARAKTYGENGVAHAFPMYQAMQVQGKTLRLSFRDAAGLTTRAGAKPAGFAIAGTDNKWAWADAVINKDTVVLSSAAVAVPAKVRYGWGQNPPCNLFNADGLPASPFQTDGPQLPTAARPGPDRSGRTKPASATTAKAVDARDAIDALGRHPETPGHGWTRRPLP